MRFYSFTNFYLSPVQQGIQPAHCIADMFVKYCSDSPQKSILFDWAGNHKMMVCLNGGNAAGVRRCYTVLEELGGSIGLPFGRFYEDGESLDCTMTCCGIVVPSLIYEASAALRGNATTVADLAYAALPFRLRGLTADEIALAQFLTDFGLAK